MPRRSPLCTCVAVWLVAATAAADGSARAPEFWWPDHLDLAPLRQHASESDPLGGEFDYARAFAGLDLAAVKRDIARLYTVIRERELGIRATPAPAEVATKAKKTKAKKADAADEAVKEEAE